MTDVDKNRTPENEAFTARTSCSQPYMYLCAAQPSVMRTIEVTDSKDISRWMQLPYRQYAHTPHWIPPLTQDIEKVFDPARNKAFQHGKVVRYLLLDRADEAIGRIAAFVNEKMSNPLDYPVGGIGFFECIDNQEAANLLFDTAKNWLIQQGMEGMDGPVNFGEKNQFWGLLTDNFEDAPTYGFNYNPPYYESLFRNYGFQTFYNQLVYYRLLDHGASESLLRKASIAIQRYGIEVRNAQGMSMNQIADDFVTIYNGAWATHEGFREMTIENGRKLIHSMKAAMDPRIVIYAYHENRPVGFMVCIPELNQIFRHVHGNLNLWGKLKFLWHKKMNPPDTMYGIVFGVVKDMQGKGVEAALIKFAHDTIYVNHWYKQMIMTWIGDFNPKMIYVVESLEATVWRKYATLRYNFDPARPFERHPEVGRKKDS